VTAPKYPVVTREQSEASLAHYIFHRIQNLKGNLAVDILELGQLFSRVKSEQLYKYNSCDTFEEYIGQPEIGFKRSSVYNFMKIYAFYIEKMKSNSELLTEIGHSKLLLIMPAIEKEPDKIDEWLHNAKEWSRSDLMKAQGKDLKPTPKTPPFSPGLSSYKSYKEYVKAHPCILCDKSPVDPAHFPKTEAAGGKFFIPLCRACHRHQEDLPKGDFIRLYCNKIDNYLYELVQLLWRE